VSRALRHFSHTNDWMGFVHAARTRASLIPCAQARSVTPTSRTWYRTCREISLLCICESCYYDFFALTPYEDEFEAYPPMIGSSAKEHWNCDMAVPKLAMAHQALMDASEPCPFNVWWEAARALVVSPQCLAEGAIKDSSWYVLATEEADFDICPSCFYAIIRPLGPALQSHFRLTRYPRGTIRTCDLAARRPRFPIYKEKLEEAVDLQQPELFTTYISRWSKIPPCPRDVPKPNRRWWGNKDFSACEECAEILKIPSSPFASQLPLRGQLIAAKTDCGLYSPLMRKLWFAALRSGNLDEFCKAARHRA